MLVAPQQQSPVFPNDVSEREFGAVAHAMTQARSPLLAAAGDSMASVHGPRFAAVDDLTFGVAARRFAEGVAAFYMLKHCPAITSVAQIEQGGAHGEPMPLVCRVRDHLAHTLLRPGLLEHVEFLRLLSHKALHVHAAQPLGPLTQADRARTVVAMMALAQAALHDYSTGKVVKLEMHKPPLPTDLVLPPAPPLRPKPHLAKLPHGHSQSAPCPLRPRRVRRLLPVATSEQGALSRIPAPVLPGFTPRNGAFNALIVDTVQKETRSSHTLGGDTALPLSSRRRPGEVSPRSNAEDGPHPRHRSTWNVTASPVLPSIIASPSSTQNMQQIAAQVASGPSPQVPSSLLAPPPPRSVACKPRFPADLQCTEFVQQGACPRGDACPLRHADKCFANNRSGCPDLGCPYAHVALCRDRGCAGAAFCAFDHLERGK